MSIGLIFLIITGILIYFGLAERVLDRMYLTDKQALLVLGLIIVGSYIDIPITQTPIININVGGAILPIILAIYVLTKAKMHELLRAIFSIIVTTGVIYTLTQVYQFEEGHTLIDPTYLFGIVAGVTAYITSRSRRTAFITGTLGFLGYDLIHVWRITFGGVPGEAEIGGAGALDTVFLSGLIAVILAEVIGESSERLSEKIKKEPPEDRVDNVEYADFSRSEDDE
ncbi:MAG: DUF1614 domain-containing protein [Bacillota bacterium]